MPVQAAETAMKEMELEASLFDANLVNNYDHDLMRVQQIYFVSVQLWQGSGLGTRMSLTWDAANNLLEQMHKCPVLLCFQTQNTQDWFETLGHFIQ